MAIIGLGLIGGSLGLALTAAGWEVTGFARHHHTAARALVRGAISREAEGLAEAVSGADLVVLATPISALPEVMDGIAPHLPPGAVVTDVASTKAQVMAWAAARLPGVSFVGGHPMAGREKLGLEAAQAELFRGAAYCIVALPGTPAPAVERVKQMALAVGAIPLMLEATEHDYLVAGISHLPLLVATALVRAAAGDPAWPTLQRLAATGFRDTTRLASGSPEMGRDMALTNRQAILAWLDRFSRELEGLRYMVEEGDASVEEALRQARSHSEQWLEAKGW
ncbi:MAG: prephenate dehydrogenase/arogenate dehydrogenase family protein [Dehalococcoidia bacterium]